MKLCRLIKLSLLLCTFPFLAPAAQAQTSAGLRVKIECEDPAGIFLDRDTIALRRSILFSIHLFNETAVQQTAVLTWRVHDPAGRVAHSGSERYLIPAGSFVSQRELFLPPGRGGFLLSADGYSRQSGADLRARQEFPFAVLAAPAAMEVRPVILLDAPLQLSDTQLDTYVKLGARALRSTITPTAETAANFWQNLDSALQARSTRGLATVGVLEAPVGVRTARGRGRDDEDWLQFALLALTRTPAIRTWEVVGGAAPETVSELARAARNMYPPRGVLVAWPGAAGPDLKRLLPADGLVFPLAEEAVVPHPAALRRAMVLANRHARSAGLASFHVRGVGAPHASNARESAAAMTAETVAALSVGAQGTSTPLEVSGVSGNLVQFKMTRGAALSAMNNYLADSQFHSELFPSSPIVMASLFTRENNRGSVAVLWTAPGQNGRETRGRLDAWFNNAELFDVLGNPLAQAERKALQIPLGAHPVYLVSPEAPEAVARALSEASVSGIESLAAQVLPITQPIEFFGEERPKDNRFAPASQLSLRVRLHNVGVASATGTLRITPPEAWQVVSNSQEFSLQPGESRIYSFAVSQVRPLNDYRVGVRAAAVMTSGGKTSRGNWSWSQSAPVVTAHNVAPEENMQIDGVLNDWRNTFWMTMASRQRVESRMAIKWDATRLYIAARVKEPRLQPRRSEDSEYDFWNSDAIQIGFGVRDAIWTHPGSPPFRDTDFGFLLSPFHTRPDGTVEGRVLRLWSANVPFGNLPDRVRWGGAVPGARLEVRRDERDGTTIYEAAIPLSEIPGLDPATRLASSSEADTPVRFSWKLHNDEGSALQWSAISNVFDWWNNTSSFLPAQHFSLSAQTLLGFTQRGAVATNVILPEIAPSPVRDTPPAAPAEEHLPYLPPVTAPAVSTPPAAPRPTPAPPARPTIQPMPLPPSTPAPSRSLPRPVPVEPIPPDLLPPAPPQ